MKSRMREMLPYLKVGERDFVARMMTMVLLAGLVAGIGVDSVPAAPLSTQEAKPMPLLVARADAPVKVTAVDFKEDGDTAIVIIRMEGQVPYAAREDGNRIVLSLPNATIPESLLRAIDTKGFGSSVLSIQPSQNQGRGTAAVVAILLREKRPYEIVWDGNDLDVRIQNSTTEPVAVPQLPVPDLTAPGPGVVEVPKDTARGIAQAASRPAETAAPQRQTSVAAAKPAQTVSAPVNAYTGRKISLDFKDADIQNVLRLIAEVSGKNIVISDAVQGKVTIRLLNVPWDMALDVILKTYALDKEELAQNIVRVAPYTQMKKERDEAAQAAKALQQVESLITKVVTVNYAKAEELQSMLEKMKSARADANILVDQRTNSLVLKDLPATVREMIGLIEELDWQTPQVLIESKIVDLDVEFERALGIQWGTMYQAGPATGNPTGMNFPNTASVGGASNNISGETSPGVSNPVVNLPAAVGSGAGGALGFSLASITNSFQLDVQLSALERDKHARILSSPRVATLNNQEARIEQGKEVPYQTTSDEGTKTEFKDAMLRLTVTPQVNVDKSIIMKIVVSNDSVLGDSAAGAIIGKKEASTSVLVADGETAVIGGIYTHDDQKQMGGVPWLMDIPGLGYLFKKEEKKKSRTELLIFITPRIIPARRVPVEEWVQ